MKRIGRAAVAVAVITVVLAVAPAAGSHGVRARPVSVTGWASAYAPGVMEDTIRYRLDNNLWRVPPPHDWYTAHGAIATNDCSQVGSMATMIDPGGRAYRVLVADCAGRDSADWMTRHNIVAELDAALWAKLTAAHGRPLAVEVRE